MVGPYQRTGKGNSYTRDNDCLVAKGWLAREDRNDVGDHSHAWQHHDVDCRVGVNPEQVLEHDRIAALGRVKEAGAEDPLGEEHGNGDADDRSGENLDPCGGIERPGKERDAHPGHAFGFQPMNGGHKIESGEDRRETEEENRDCCH